MTALSGSCSVLSVHSQVPLQEQTPHACWHNTSPRHWQRRALCRVMASAQANSVDVAIVGGGLGGLTAALALRRALPDASVRVYEQFPEYVKAGALLGLAPNAQAALDAIDPALLEHSRRLAVPDGRSIAATHEGTVIREGRTGTIVGGGTAEDLKEMCGRAFLRLGWWEMHKVLYGALPSDTIVFDSKFAGYDENESGVTLRFSSPAHGGESEVRAKVVVGADGGFSAVRARCLDDGPPKTPGTVLWRARVPAESMAGLIADGVVERAWLGGGMLGNAWLVNPETREGSWVGGTNRENLEALGVDFDANPASRTGQQVLPVGKTAHERAQRVFAGMPEEYRAMMEATDPASVVEHGVWARDVERPWGAGRVTMVGDAAHPIRPVTGQGFAQAAEDAVELAAQLRRHGLMPGALRAYETSRLDRVKRIADFEWELGEDAYRDHSQDTEEMKAAAVNARMEYAKFLFQVSFDPLV